MYVVGLATAVLITVRRWEAQGGSRATVYDVAMWGFPAGVIGGRLYFDLTSSGDGRLRRAGVSVAAFMDAAAPALLVGQAIGRIGNYFNQELFRRPNQPALGA